jgi:hypothetical protein
MKKNSIFLFVSHIGFVFFVTMVLALLPQNSLGAIDKKILDVSFTRLEGKPIINHQPFIGLGYEGPATIKIFNGGISLSKSEKISSATITLNGKVIFGGSDFNKNVSVLEKNVTILEGYNYLEVKLESKPSGKITIQIFQTSKGPIPPITTLEEDRKVTMTITPSQGGIVQAVSSDGFQSSLTIPPNAIFDTNPVSITVTPISGIQNLPTGGAFVAGVRLHPEGTLFFKPVTLTLKVPAEVNDSNLYVICYTGSNGEFYTVPTKSLDKVNLTIDITLFHFSDVVAVTSSSNPGSVTTTISDIYKSALSDAYKSGDEWLYDDIMNDWFYKSILPDIKGSIDITSLSKSVNSYFGFLNCAELIEYAWSIVDSGIDGIASDAIRKKFIELSNNIDTVCKSETQKCNKQLFLNHFEKLYRMCMNIGGIYCDPETIPYNSPDFCGGATKDIPVFINIDPRSLEMCEGDIEFITADVKNILDLSLKEVPITWTIGNPSLAGISNSTFQTVAVNAFDIPGLTPQSTAIKATEECGVYGTANITVIPDPAPTVVSLEVPRQGWGECPLVGRSYKLKTIVRDSNGVTISNKCLKTNWTSSDPSVALLTENIDTGEWTASMVGAGKTVLTASAGGRSDSFIASVTEFPICGTWHVTEEEKGSDCTFCQWTGYSCSFAYGVPWDNYSKISHYPVFINIHKNGNYFLTSRKILYGAHELDINVTDITPGATAYRITYFFNDPAAAWSETFGGNVYKDGDFHGTSRWYIQCYDAVNPPTFNVPYYECSLCAGRSTFTAYR